MSLRQLSLFLVFLILPLISANCDSEQIDINSASAQELDELYRIGPVKAEAIIDARPFETIDDLIDVNGIGEATLEGIKSQGLACVEDPKDGSEEKEEIDVPVNVEEADYLGADTEESKILEPIRLDSEVIKTTGSREVKSTVALYSLVAFGVLLCFLFLLRKKKNGLA